MFLCSSKPLDRGSLCHCGHFTTPGLRHDPDKLSAWFYWYAQDLKCTYVYILSYMSSRLLDPKNLKQLTHCGLKSARFFLTYHYSVPYQVFYTHPLFQILCITVY